MYLKYSLFINKYLGVYVDKNATVVTKLLVYFVRCALILGTLDMVVFSFLDIILRDKILFHEIAYQVGIVGISSLNCIRLIYFFKYGREVDLLIKKMNKYFQLESATGINETSMSQPISISNRISYFWSMVAMFASLIPIVGTLGMIPFNGKQLLVPAWYPYDWRKPGFYETTIAIQIFAHIAVSLTFIIPEVFFATSLMLLAGQLKILGWEMSHFIYTPLLNFGVSREDIILFSNFFNNDNMQSVDNGVKNYEGILSIINNRRFQVILESNMIKTFRKYLKILEIIDEFNNFYSSLSIILLGGLEFSLIFIPYTLIVTNDNRTAVNMVVYFFGTFGNGLFFCFFGQIIKNEKDNLFRKLYECPWYICKNIKIRRIYLQMTTSLLKPCFIRAGQYIPLTLATFAMICRSSGSYVVVLKEITQRK